MCTRSELQIVLKRVEIAAKQLYGDKLNRIILYGSYARGDNTEESDIDIMIILDCDDISLEQEVFLSISLRDKRHFEDNVSCLPFYQNIEREGIAVYG